MRAHLLFVMIASGCAVTAATACSSPDVALEANAKKATQASSVSVSMFDKAGNALGSCSGTLVSKDLVLTAGHCVAGAAKWTIDASGADASSESTHAVTPWKAFGSDLAHPDHSDVALILLDKPIELDSYPAIATSKLADGAKALRYSRSSAAVGEAASSEVAVSGMSKKGFRLNYAAKIEKTSFLDTGGAIVDAKTGKIHGVVSGVGKESGLLHIARVDNFAKWINKATACMGSTSLGVRTYGASSGGSSWGGGSSSWGGGSSDWGGYGGSGSKIDGGTSVPGAGLDAGAGTSGTSGTPGSSSGSSGSGGSSGSVGDGDTSGAGSSCPGVPACEGGDCPGVPGGGTPGSSSGSSGTSGSDGTNGGSDEVCPGPPNCPEPDSQACTGAACGGCGGVAGCVDATIDYGNCASCGPSNGTGTPPVVR